MDSVVGDCQRVELADSGGSEVSKNTLDGGKSPARQELGRTCTSVDWFRRLKKHPRVFVKNHPVNTLNLNPRNLPQNFCEWNI